MELFQLRAFLAVAEELHFGQAAEKLGIAQPPLSRVIRQLEDELGAELFYRTTRSVKLAPAGEALVEPARSILDSVRETEDAIRFTKAGEIGTVRMGFAGASSNHLVARLLTVTRKEKPGIKIDLDTTTYAAEALAGLTDGSLDLAIVRWKEAPPHISGRPIMVERLVVGLHRDHPLAGAKELTPHELKDEEILLLAPVPRSAMRDAIFEAFLREGLTPRVAQSAPDNWIITALVNAGYGPTIAFDSIISDIADPNVTWVPFKTDVDPSIAYLAHRTDDTNPALLELLEIAERVVPSIT